MILADFDWFVTERGDSLDWRSYKFPSGLGCDLLRHDHGYMLTRGDGSSQHNLTEAEVVAELSRLAAAPALAA